MRFSKITYPLGTEDNTLSVMEVVEGDLRAHPNNGELMSRESLLYRVNYNYTNTELFVQFTDVGLHMMTWGRWRAAASILKEYYEGWEPYGVRFEVWTLEDPINYASGEMRLNSGLGMETETTTGLETETE